MRSRASSGSPQSLRMQATNSGYQSRHRYNFSPISPMTPYIASYLWGIITLLILDGIMITYVVLPLFRRHIGDIIATTPNMLAAWVFYLLYIGFILFLLVLPAMRWEIQIDILMRNAFLIGIMCYMTYELTNMTMIRGWSWGMVATDVLWGWVLTVIVTYVMYRVFSYFI